MAFEAIVNMVLIGILVVSTIVGLAKGFLRQAIELAGAIASFILAILLSGAVAEFLAKQVQFPYSVALVVGFVGLLLVGLFAARFVAAGVAKIVKMTVLNFVDRLAGGVLGLIFGAIICSLLITATIELPLDYEFRSDVANSSVSLLLRPIAADLFDWVLSKAPSDMQWDEIFRRAREV